MLPRHAIPVCRPTRLVAPALLASLLLTACGGDDGPGDGLADAPETPAERPTDPRTPTPQPTPTDTPDAPADPEPTEPRPVPGWADGLPAVGPDVWTAARVRGGPEAGPGDVPPTVTGVRAARHDDFDRFVIELDPAGGLPGFTAEYVDRPVRECGSGRTVELPGDGWLELHLTGARAHDDDGRPTVTTREGEPRLPVLLAHDMTCDFEGQVEWVLAVASPNEFRVLDLREPWRLVVDVRH